MKSLLSGNNIRQKYFQGNILRVEFVQKSRKTVQFKAQKGKMADKYRDKNTKNAPYCPISVLLLSLAQNVACRLCDGLNTIMDATSLPRLAETTRTQQQKIQGLMLPKAKKPCDPKTTRLDREVGYGAEQLAVTQRQISNDRQYCRWRWWNARMGFRTFLLLYRKPSLLSSFLGF